uniref:Uncharacterized protein n=1 Tax=Timema poppense TaxID=170557 RepID=A0A7R9DU38_TIMPO|nr:unnamed protein product [Timema poppensis]
MEKTILTIGVTPNNKLRLALNVLSCLSKNTLGALRRKDEATGLFLHAERSAAYLHDKLNKRPVAARSKVSTLTTDWTADDGGDPGSIQRQHPSPTSGCNLIAVKGGTHIFSLLIDILAMSGDKTRDSKAQLKDVSYLLS